MLLFRLKTVLPGYVMTNMLNGTSFVKSSWTVPNPQDFVEANFRTLGLESRTASFWYHKLMVNTIFDAALYFLGWFKPQFVSFESLL